MCKQGEKGKGEIVRGKAAGPTDRVSNPGREVTTPDSTVCPGCWEVIDPTDEQEVLGRIIHSKCGEVLPYAILEHGTIGGVEKSGGRRKKKPIRMEDITLTALKDAARAVGVSGFSKYTGKTKNELANLITRNIKDTTYDIPESKIPELLHLILVPPTRPDVKELWWFRGEKAMAMERKGHSVDEFVREDIPKILKKMSASPLLREYVRKTKDETDRVAVLGVLKTWHGPHRDKETLHKLILANVQPKQY